MGTKAPCSDSGRELGWGHVPGWWQGRVWPHYTAGTHALEGAVCRRKQVIVHLDMGNR